MNLKEFVIDSDMFKKISSDQPTEMTVQQLLDSKYKNNVFSIDDVRECYYFHDIIKAIVSEKCLMAYNKAIRDEIKEVVDNCPNEIKSQFHFIISNKGCKKKIDDVWSHEIRDSFLGTPLENKIPYLNVAYFLDSIKLILSTEKNMNTIYTECSGKLCDIEVICRNVHFVKKEIFNEKDI